MRRGISLVTILTIACLVAAPACPPNPPAPPNPNDDGGPSPIPLVDAQGAPDAPNVNPSDCAKACANLFAIGCKEGEAGSCVPVCERANGTLTDLHPRELARAKTKEEARATKSVACP